MVDELGAVYVVTDAALYRLRGRRGKRTLKFGACRVRRTRAIGEAEPEGRLEAGTTPTLIGGGRWVAITDNADPMNVVAYQRQRRPDGKRRICRSRSSTPAPRRTDQSLIGAGNAIVVENNYGYTIAEVDPAAMESRSGLRACGHRRGRARLPHGLAQRRAGAVRRAQALTRAGLLYTYTLPPEYDASWYLTALDFSTGETVYRRLAGSGLGYNNNYAPVTLAQDGTAYVGVLGGGTRRGTGANRRARGGAVPGRHRDPLTRSLLSLRAFRTQLELDVARAQRYRRPLTVALLDIDGFRQLNLRHGYAAGDALLAAVGGPIADETRVQTSPAGPAATSSRSCCPRPSGRRGPQAIERILVELEDLEAGRRPRHLGLGRHRGAEAGRRPRPCSPGRGRR